MEEHSDVPSSPTVVKAGDDTWVLALLAVLVATVLAYLLRPEKERPKYTRVPTPKQDLTLQQLRKYNGTDGRDIYVAVKGIIFNVSSHPSGRELYGRCVCGRISVCVSVLRFWNSQLNILRVVVL